MAQVFDKDLQREIKVGRVYFNNVAAPVATSDLAHGYRIGDVWVTNANVIYMCANDATGAAVWSQISN